MCWGGRGKRRDALILPFQQIRNPTTTKKKSSKLERERERERGDKRRRKRNWVVEKRLQGRGYLKLFLFVCVFFWVGSGRVGVRITVVGFLGGGGKGKRGMEGMSVLL